MNRKVLTCLLLAIVFHISSAIASPPTTEEGGGAVDVLWSINGDHPNVFGPPATSLEIALKQFNDALNEGVIDELVGHPVPRTPVLAEDLKLEPIPEHTQIKKMAGRMNGKGPAFIDSRPKRTAGTYGGWISRKWGEAIGLVQACSNPALLELPAPPPLATTTTVEREGGDVTVNQQTNVTVIQTVPQTVAQERMMGKGPSWPRRHWKALTITGICAVVGPFVVKAIIKALDHPQQTTVVVCSGPPGSCT